MKKSIALVLGCLFLFASASAAVTVKQGNKTVKYADSSVIKVTGAADTTIDYNGVKIFVPKGVTLTISKTTNGSVSVKGSNLSGVQIGNNTINTAGPVSLAVQPKTQAITVSSGTVQVTDASGQTASYAAGAVVAPSASASTEAASVPAFVAADMPSNTASQQAVQNREEDPTLSPSAPRP